MAGCNPLIVAMTLPRIVPSGMVPHTMKRIVAFIRTCIDGVV